MVLPRFGTRPSAMEARERPAAWRRRYGRLRVAFFLTVAMLVVFGILANRADERRRRTPGQFQRAERLTPGDFEAANGSRVDVWLIRLDRGQALRATARSTDFVPFLYATGPLSDDHPHAVAKGTTSREGESTIAFSARSAGEYGLGVVSIGPAAYGAYQLSSNYRLTAPFEKEEIDDVEDVVLMICVVLFMVQLSGVPIRAFWRSPDRILLLRPFGQGPVSRALKRFTRRNLAYRGFTFTLADRHLRHSAAAYVLSHVPLDLGSMFAVFYRPLFRRAHRFVFVRKRRDLLLLRSRLRSRWRLGGFWQSWFGLNDRINKIRSSDELWKDCIGVLLDDCQVVVVDLSHIGAGTTWELEELFRRRYDYKALFLVPDDDRQVAVAGELVSRMAVQHGGAGEAVPDLLRYRPDDGSAVDPAAFERAYAAAASSDRQPAAAALPMSTKAVLAVAPSAVLGPLWSPAAIVLAWLALRDIRRANGMLRGDVLAHMAVAFNSLVLGMLAVAGGLWFFGT